MLADYGPIVGKIPRSTHTTSYLHGDSDVKGGKIRGDCCGRRTNTISGWGCKLTVMLCTGGDPGGGGDRGRGGGGGAGGGRGTSSPCYVAEGSSP